MINLKPTIIDRYIIKKFIGTYLFSLALISVIIIVFNISENVDDFVEKHAPLYDIIFRFYLNLVPQLTNMFSSLFVFITVIFFTSKMAGHSEIIAILSGGVSFGRLMYPYFLSALVIFTTTLLANLFIIPPANAERLEFEEQYLHSFFTNDNRNIHFQLEPDEYVYMESFMTWNNTAYKFSLEKFDGKKLLSKLQAEQAIWDTSFNGWRVRNYYIRHITDSSETIKRGKQLDTVISITAEDLRRRANSYESLDYADLDNEIDLLKLRGDKSVKYALVEKYKRVTVPFSVFILTLIGVSLSSQKVRGGIGLKIGLGVGLSFSYILFLKFAEMFVFSDFLSPLVALWIPNLLFLVVAIFLYIKAPK
jgi:lipopolysaccharide export system permease protein